MVADSRVSIPRSVDEPYLWQQTYGASPNGPALLVFSTGHSLNGETARVIVGRDGSYRVMYRSPGEEFGSLSPDGRYVLRSGLLDLVSGKTKYTTPAGGWEQWTWSADGRFAVAALNHNTVETYYPDGTSDDGIRPDDVIVLDVATGQTHTVYRGDADEMRAAFSPDGQRLAITVGLELKPQRLRILDTATGKVLQELSLTEHQRLAGPAAWAPDGRTILLTYGEQNSIVQRVDAAAATVIEENWRSRPGTVEIVGWRDGAPIATLSTEYSCDIVQLTDGGETVLHKDCPLIPRDLMEQGAWDGPPLHAPWWQAQWWFYAGIAAFAIVVTVILQRLRAGRRLRRAAAAA
jgi:dipeptidyl aminopeptidase/acylaminoacyl peptidase